ncbi:hypothetical protein CEXT_223141 [Caerostris extrusa]|uniref:Uncharacterized protein n=1 Tax=Caerostris extrusa TaxID=172846 RepID=A0AAV4RUV5_CAEEX|nr:hypothetical protein CEXT_223141 [Caerostris extrusa]
MVPKERVSYFSEKIRGKGPFPKKTAEFDEDKTWKLLNLTNSTKMVKLAELVDVRKSSRFDFGEKVAVPEGRKILSHFCCNFESKIGKRV